MVFDIELVLKPHYESMSLIVSMIIIGSIMTRLQLYLGFGGLAASAPFVISKPVGSHGYCEVS